MYPIECLGVIEYIRNVVPKPESSITRCPARQFDLPFAHSTVQEFVVWWDAQTDPVEAVWGEAK